MKKRSKYKKKQENRWFARIDIFIPVVILISLINPLRAAISQYYILEYPDDIVWVHYAQEHFYNISGLFDKIGTGFRPVINVLYYLGYALWGSNETYYYLMNGALFAGTMVFLYLLIRMLHSRIAGMLAVLLYLFLDASFILVWKMNYTTSIAEMFFITASLYYSIHFFEKKDNTSLAWAIVLGILAFFSKEPSMLIIPAVNIIYLLHKKDMRARNRVIAIAVNLLPVMLLFVMTVYLMPEVSVSADASLSERVRERLLFYVEQELSWQLKNPYIFFLGIIGTFYFRKFDKEAYGGIQIDMIKNVVSISLIVAVYLALQMGTLYSLSGAIVVILLQALGFVLGNPIQRLGIAWFGVGFVPLLLTSQAVQPTYLAEANLGMSLLLGVTISEYLKYNFSRKSDGIKDRIIGSRIFKTANIAIVGLILILQLSVIPTQISNTNNYHRMVSDSQTNFKEAVIYLKAFVPQNGTVYYISPEERTKVGGGQIDSEVFRWLLCFKGRCDIEIKPLSSLDASAETQQGGYVALLSNSDVYIFVNEYKSLTTSNIFISQKEIKNGNSVAYILGLKST